MTIKEKEFQYDLDPDIIFNFTSDHIQYSYTKESSEHEETEEIETIYAANLIPTKDLKIKFVLKCRDQRRLPILVIIAVDMLKNNYIFCYNVVDRQLTQAVTKKPLEYKCTQASITQDPIKVAFMGSQMSDSETCYALVIGTENGTATLILLKIEEPIFEANLLSIEPMVSEAEAERLGSVTAIHILHSDDGDKRMGHADPQIALGFSLGSILIYRFRANVYWSKASRFRPPVDLSEYTEFREFPIKYICCTRSYNSLAMTVSFVQEKPHNVEKYQYSSTYVKIVEVHGNLTHKQRKIINPDEALADVIEARLLASSLKTEELDNIVQLSILFEGVDTFGLNIWHINPNNVHEELNIHLPAQPLLNKLLFRRKLQSNNCIGFYKHTPQKLVQRMLQEYSRSNDQERAPKRRMGGDHADTGVKKKGRKKKVSFEDDVLTDVSEFEREDSQVPKDDVEPVEQPSKDNSKHDEEIMDAETVAESENTKEASIAEDELPLDEPVGAKELDELTLVETEGLDESTLVDTEELGNGVSSTTVSKEEELKSNAENTTTSSTPTYDSGAQTREALYSPLYEDLLASVINAPSLAENESSTLDAMIELPTQLESNQSPVESDQKLESVEVLAEDTSTNVERASDEVQIESVETSVEITTETVIEQVSSVNREEPEEVSETIKSKSPKDTVVSGDNYVADEEPTTAAANDDDNDLTDDYVLVESNDSLPNEDTEAVQIQSGEEEEEISNDDVAVKYEQVEEDDVPVKYEEVAENEADENDEDSVQIIKKEEPVEDDDEEEEDVTAMDLDDIIAASAAGVDSDSDGPQSYEYNDEEMGDGPDYDDDAFSLGDIENRSLPDNNDECILLSSGGEEDINEEEEEEDSEAEDQESDHDIAATSEDGDSIMMDSLSDVGSLQQSFVPASNSTTPQDTPQQQQEQSTPVIDYVPVSQQDLLRLLQHSSSDDIRIPTTRESTIDSTSGYIPDPYSTENTQTPTSTDGDTLKVYDTLETPSMDGREESIEITSNNDTEEFLDSPTEVFTDSVQSLVEEEDDDTSNKDTTDADRMETASNDEFSECVEEMEEVDAEEQQRIAAEAQRQHDMEQIRLKASNEFSTLLYEIFGDESIDHFMDNTSLISQDKLDEIGSSCWFNPNPHMKLFLLRYCSKHNLGRESILLCRLLMNTTSDFTKEERMEYKQIYMKYLRDFPSYHHGEVVNIFHGEGRRRLLLREMEYYKTKESDDTNIKQKQSYMKYYGFGLR